MSCDGLYVVLNRVLVNVRSDIFTGTVSFDRFEVFSIVLVIISVYKFTRTEREENCVLSVIRYTRFL